MRVQIHRFEVAQELGRDAGREGGQRQGGTASGEVELNRARDPVQALAVAVGGRVPPPLSPVVRGEPQLAQALGVLVLVVPVRDHPGIDPPVSPAGRAPSAGGVERELLRIELGKRFPGFDVRAGGREPGEDLRRRGEEEARALSDLERPLERRSLCRIALEVADDDLDVVLLVAVELLKRIRADQAPVDPHELVALLADPVRHRLVVPLSAPHEGGAEIEVARLARGPGGEDAPKELSQSRRRERGDRPVGVRMVLDPDPRVEETQVLGDLGGWSRRST